MKFSTPLIERVFPSAKVSVCASREKSVRQGHLSTLFFWFARRPTGLSRSVLFAAAVADNYRIPASLLQELHDRYPHEDTLDGALSAVTRDLSPWDAYKDDALMGLARRLVETQGTVSMLDSFAGGGSIPLEALRLGMQTTAGDLNPVAATALETTLRALPGAPRAKIENFREIVQTTMEEIRPRLDALYALPGLGTDDALLAIFWTRVMTCPRCLWATPLMRSRKLSRDAYVEFDADCTTKSYIPRVLAGSPPVSKATNVCLQCGLPLSNAERMLAGQARTIGEMPVALLARDKEGKKYLSISAEQALRLTGEVGDNPYVRLPGVDLDNNGIRHLWAMAYGVRTTNDIFSPRQEEALACLLENLIQRTDPSEPGHERLTALLSAALMMRLTTYGSRHTWWQSNGEFPANAFGRQALPMVWDYVEIPLTSPGAGGVDSALKWITKAAAEISATPGSARDVRCAEARDTGLQTGSTRLVVIDPPYYDSITYSYLADFFHPVMRALLARWTDGWFDAAVSDRSAEAIVDRTHSAAPSPKDDAHFRRVMKEALREACRVLQDDGRLVVMYGHKQLHAWQALLYAALSEGFEVSGCRVVTAERGSKFQHSRVAHLDAVCVVSFRKACTGDARQPVPRGEDSSSIDSMSMGGEMARRFDLDAPMGRFLASVAVTPGLRVEGGLEDAIDTAIEASWNAVMSGPDNVSQAIARP